MAEVNKKSHIGIIATHPIQYHIPWFQSLQNYNGNFSLTIYYGHFPNAVDQGVGFEKNIVWDIPLFEGYSWKLAPQAQNKNVRLDKFFGIKSNHLRMFFRNEKLDLLIITGWNSLFLIKSILIAKNLGIPTIVRGESNSLRKRSIYKYWLHRILLIQFDAYLSIGRGNREFYLMHGIKEHKIFDCPYFVDNERFSIQSLSIFDKRKELRRRVNIGENDVCFLFVGKLEEKKRIIDLLMAFDSASSKIFGLHLIVVGDGKLLSEAKEYSENRNLLVTFMGFLNQTEISEAYVAADCLVLPSSYGETWGLVVNEAMASGLPAIISDQVGCGPDLIIEGITGMVFKFGDLDDLKQKMLFMAQNKEKMEKMGQHARKRIFDEYSVERAVKGTINAVSAVLNNLKNKNSLIPGN